LQPAVAWKDEEETAASFDLARTDRLKKLRKMKGSLGGDQVDGETYSSLLKERYRCLVFPA
jgi:hypothetical protein